MPLMEALLSENFSYRGSWNIVIGERCCLLVVIVVFGKLLIEGTKSCGSFEDRTSWGLT